MKLRVDMTEEELRLVLKGLAALEESSTPLPGEVVHRVRRMTREIESFLGKTPS